MVWVGRPFRPTTSATMTKMEGGMPKRPTTPRLSGNVQVDCRHNQLFSHIDYRFCVIAVIKSKGSLTFFLFYTRSLAPLDLLSCIELDSDPTTRKLSPASKHASQCESHLPGGRSRVRRLSQPQKCGAQYQGYCVEFTAVGFQLRLESAAARRQLCSKCCSFWAIDSFATDQLLRMPPSQLRPVST